ncbi:MAG: penicillin acylase family protein, partial [Candidatus Aminicenantes bacterium]|nr:penicillin acylase family protein [Candidatus Aminicenantes bacterium]
GLLSNIRDELDYGRAVARIGVDAVKAVANFHPGDPDIGLDPAIDPNLLYDDILRLYAAFRQPVRFESSDLAPAYRADAHALERVRVAAGADRGRDAFARWQDEQDVGSNNWVISGRLSESGYPIMANDPHRAQSAPSLRYWVHLVGPGWNVVGGGEPEIPGVSIGHNEYGAWGLTVFPTDSEDLYVYQTDPSDPNRYRYRNHWEEMTVITETVPVREQAPVEVELKYTRHGPVVYEDPDNNVAYAVRAAWLEPGGAPYLASLRMDQATTWEEIVAACNYSNIPGENMIWADRDGNIGWQSVGIAPIRRNFSGLVPVPGDGRYEWDGYLPIVAKPSAFNPGQGYFATANNHLTPDDYPHFDAIGFVWADPYRWARVSEVLDSGRRHAMADMMDLQMDTLSIPARTLVPLLEHVELNEPDANRARRLLLDWDYDLDPASVAAGIYVAFERRLQRAMHELLVPEEGREFIRGVSMSVIVRHVLAPGGEFGSDPIAGRDRILAESLTDGVEVLREKLGGNMDDWRYGQADYKHATIHHPLSHVLSGAMQDRYTVGPLPRGGNSYSLNNSGAGDNQTGGASFRIIVDTGDWDRAVGTNNPGQVGDPDSFFYDNLFDLWANDRFFPVFFSRQRIESVAAERWELVPGM